MLNKLTGWLFDLYTHPTKGTVLWFVGEDGKPYSFHQDLEFVFYARGSFPRLHELGKFIRGKYTKETVRLERVTKKDLFDGPQEVMGIRTSSLEIFTKLSRAVVENFSDLLFYDVDIPLTVRYAAARNVFMMARCEVTADSDNKIIGIRALDTPYDIDPKLPNLRILSLKPDTDPAHKPPRFLIAKFGKSYLRLPFNRSGELLSILNGIFASFDPDVIQTHFGDAWLFTYLLELSQKTGISFNPNRDASLPVLHRKAVDFFNYGRAHYRAPQVHLRGRWHVDVENCMTYNQYQLIGAIEQTRLSNLLVQEVARRSPGAAMAAMQVLTALRSDTLIPYQHQKGEIPKTYRQFIRADRGGLIIQPTPGVFQNVAVLYFSSMMPSLMIKYNISPETVVGIETEEEGFEIPELGVKILSRPGLIPRTLKPMRDKRLILKQLLKSVDKNDPRYRGLQRQYKVVSKAINRQSVVDAVKWLGVVCYGRLGFANATFGRINSHEVVSYTSRKMVTKAKLIAEEMGFEVLHVYVDSLMLTCAGASKEDYQELANEIKRQTQLPIDLENIYSWFAFLSSRQNPNISVANRFYGIAANKEHKIRGIALRRGDTSGFVTNTQMQVMKILAKEADPAKVLNHLPEVLDFVQTRLETLKKREVPLNELVVTQVLSRELEHFSVLSPVAAAARQLQVEGREPKRGQRIRFVYIGRGPGVHAWDLNTEPDPRAIDVPKYKELTFRAVYEVIQPFGITEKVARSWIFDKASYVAPIELVPLARRLAKQELPILANLPFLRVDRF